MTQQLITIRDCADQINGRLVNGCQPDEPVERVSCDSRSVQTGTLFVAYQGPEVDGHDYIESAYSHGAATAVVTDMAKLEGRPGILVENSQAAFSRLCAFFEGDPSKELQVIGITGTNGKTTIHWMLHHGLIRLGSPSIRIGSLGISAEGLVERTGKVQTRHSGEIVMTTPGPKEIHRSLRMAVDRGIKSCVLETSSHALHQYRVRDVHYDAAVFTNLTPDHLNYHPDMESYFEVKLELFEQLAKQRSCEDKESGGAIINTDCPYGQLLIKRAKDMSLPVLSFGYEGEPTVKILAFDQSIKESVLHLRFKNRSFTIKSNLVGNYNGSNLAAAFATLVSLNYDPEDISKALSGLPVVPGRLEPVGNDDIAVFVDYAHTGVGLESLLSSLKHFVERELWVLFGCGGGKDPRKRIDMGKAALKYADRIVLTNDNPKREDPEKIIQEILLSGCQPEFIELDRRKAIERTLKLAKKGDVVILAGKGHEDYQIIGNTTTYFSDQEEARRVLKHVFK